MSAARSYQKQRITSATVPPPKKRKRFLGLLAIILGVGVLVSGVISAMNKDKIPEEYAEQASSMTQYLQAKYGQEFIVQNVRVEGAGLGIKGAWRGDAYPASDPSLRFRIVRSQTTNKISVDTFLQELWTKQGSDKVATFMSRELPNNEGYFLTITPGSNPGIALYDSVQGSTPSLEEALAKNKNEISYSLSINDVTNTDADEPSDVTLEKAKKVLEFVKGQGAGILSMNYGFRHSSFTEQTNSGHQKYQYRIKLEREELQSATSANDMKKYFEVIE